MPTQKQLAHALGIDPALVTQYKRQGMPIDSVASAAAWREANVRPRINPRTGTKAARPTKESRYHLLRTDGQMLENRERALRVLQAEGVLVHRDKVRSEIARRLAGLRDSLLQIPPRLQSVLAAESDEAKCHDILQDELYLVLAQITEVA